MAKNIIIKEKIHQTQCILIMHFWNNKV